MQYAIEDLNPVKKKITVTVPAAEIGKAVDEAISSFRSSLKMNGFRRGKVPAALIMKRFDKEVLQQATDKLMQAHLREIIDNSAFEIVSNVKYDGSLPVPGNDFTYSLVFEVMPEFDLPNYEGLEIEQEETVPDESAIDAAVLNMRRRLAEEVPVQENRPPKDGDVAVLDFAALDDAGAVIDGFEAEDFSLNLGGGVSLPGFEDLVKGLAQGEEKEEPITFPEKFSNPALAGRTVRMRVKLKELVEKILPAEDDAFAREAGDFESPAKLRENLRESFLRRREENNRAAAKMRLLDKLLEQTEFTVPEAMIEEQFAILRQNLFDVLINRSLPDDELKAMQDEIRPEAERRAKSQVFLLTVAKKQGLTVSGQDIDVHLHKLARQSKQEFKTVREYYVRNNLLSGLANALMADKGMDELYSKARIVPVPPSPAEGDFAAPADGDSAAPAEGDSAAPPEGDSAVLADGDSAALEAGAASGGTDDRTDDAQGRPAADETRLAAEQEADESRA
ncbi:MAG: trigger factor [Desulfovibrio sp.]|jgi:trigger factor|nr:trigger factor [Desulfovibrio sp.]